MATTQPVATGLPAPSPAPLARAAGVELLGGRNTGDGTLFLIKRGDGRMFELSPLVYAVAEALDAERRPSEVADVVTAGYGRLVTPENVRYLVDNKLRPLGLTGDQATHPSDGGSPLGLRVRAGVIPDRVVGVLAGGLRWLFVPPLVVLFLSALALFDVWLVGHGVSAALSEVVARPSSTLLVIVLTLVGAAFHEFGHAAAARYSGARPGVIGIGVYLLWPVFFNDLNDSYRLDRRGRLRCDLGGVYFNGVFAVVLGVAYAVTGIEVLLLTAAVQHVAILQQFLPFVRLDGYYIVSDLVGVPDLFRFTAPVLRSLLPGHRAPELAGLRPGARAAVVAWVCATVPALALCSVVLLVSLPELVETLWRTSASQLHVVASAVRVRAPWPAALGVLHLILLAVPLVGVGAAVTGAVGGRLRSSSATPDSGADVDGVDEPASTHEWADPLRHTDDGGLRAEDRWDAPDVITSLLWLDPVDRWLPLPGHDGS